MTKDNMLQTDGKDKAYVSECTVINKSPTDGEGVNI